jgi:hypothetical protein
VVVHPVRIARHLQHAGPGVQQLVRPDGRANARYVEVEHETVPPGGEAVGTDHDCVACRHVEYADTAVGRPVVEQRPVAQPDTKPDRQPADHAEHLADAARHHNARTNHAPTEHAGTEYARTKHAGTKYARTKHDPVDPRDHTTAVEPDRIRHPQPVTNSRRTHCDGDVTHRLSRFGERL